MQLLKLLFFLYLTINVKCEYILNEKCSESTTLFSNAGEELVYLKNKANSSSNIIRNCKLTINSTRQNFLLRLDKSRDCQLNNSANTLISIRKCSMQIGRNASMLLNESKVCEIFKNQNFLLIEANCFDINLAEETNNEELNSTIVPFKQHKPFEAVDSISITAFENNEKDACFKCKTPLNVCISTRLKCDRIESCADGSDEIDCDFLNNQNQTMNLTVYSNVTNSTVSSFVTNAAESSSASSRASYLIGFLVVLVVLTGALGGVWAYGRRRRKWREFLAQLDNNTDWEYEQLEDAPSISSSHMATMTPVFNISNHLNTNNKETNNNQNNYNANTSTNIRPGINERTPITFNT